MAHPAANVDGNGSIDTGRELFGVDTEIVDANTGLTRNASSGFEALKAQDGNGDQLIDANDAVFSQLRLWRDLNQDGQSQTGELFTLQPITTIGTDPKCNIVLVDKFMSSKHAEIKAENGMWVLRDSGSTNGTYVNNKRVDRHELVDNDFVKFGSAMLKFKSL